MWLDSIPECFREEAAQNLAAGDPMFFGLASNVNWLQLVLMNNRELRSLGIYEKSLMDAYMGTRTNFCRYDVETLLYLFKLADKDKLLAAGEPLPDGESFTVYRGVSGRGRMRRVRGFSWTLSVEKAVWFANRFPGWLPDPAVYRVRMLRSEVYFYTNGRSEAELVGWPSRRPCKISTPG